MASSFCALPGGGTRDPPKCQAQSQGPPCATSWRKGKWCCCRNEEGGFGRAMVGGGCESLQRIALSACMINDHMAGARATCARPLHEDKDALLQHDHN